MSPVYIPAALRQLVVERADRRCEYCGMPESTAFAVHEIDHIVALKHGGHTDADNLAFSCALCNKHKGSDVASVDQDTGQIVPLYHPRRERWTDHFQLQAGRIVPLTTTGRATARLLQLNHPERAQERELLVEAGLFKVPD